VLPTSVLSPAPLDRPLAGVLRPGHERWLAEARRFLEPAAIPEADFWTRWAAVRYLADEFRKRAGLERALVAELRPSVRADLVDHLLREADRLAALRLELDRLGRRRGTAEAMAAGTQALLRQLTIWLAEIELAAAGLSCGRLSPTAEALARQLASIPPQGG
jgi:hypothetical protein